MAKQVSLRKIWHLCNEALKDELKNKDLISAVIEAYQLLKNNNETNAKKVISKFSDHISADNINELCIYIESLLNLPIKDGDFLIEKYDRKVSITKPVPLVFYLHNIRSGFNIGSMIRLADGFNIQSVILSGYTADITNSQVKRASLGAEKNITILKENNNFAQLSTLIKNGYQPVALETASPNTELNQFHFNQKTILIVGNEKNGLDSNLLKLCDHIVKIPMYGVKNSLNVVSALSMTAYEWNKQCRR